MITEPFTLVTKETKKQNPKWLHCGPDLQETPEVSNSLQLSNIFDFHVYVTYWRPGACFMRHL